jgi:hypothetical protein
MMGQVLDFLISEVYFACKQMTLADIAKDHTVNVSLRSIYFSLDHSSSVRRRS